MKICAIICEYNPFHNGHLLQLNTAKERSGADAILCIMSGNFLQRGEAAILDKHTRAKHAIHAGADVVIELPAMYATANAELFAKGAVHILSSIPSVSTLSFGAENTDITALKLGARYLNHEPKEVSTRIQAQLQAGVSYAKARANAFAGFIPLDLLSSPNNILGLEYTRAILAKECNIEILPIQRMGGGYLDKQLHDAYSSATAIRASLQNGVSVQNAVPPFVLEDLKAAKHITLDALEKYAFLNKPPEEIAQTCDCKEGLENAFKKASLLPQPLVETLTSTRYTSSRIRRIALQNLLNIRESQIRAGLEQTLYLRVLAAKKDRTDVLSALAQSTFPLLMRAHDHECLSNAAQQSYTTDIFSENVYSLFNDNQKEKQILI